MCSRDGNLICIVTGDAGLVAQAGDHRARPARRALPRSGRRLTSAPSRRLATVIEGA
jgi:hypothetical protein